MDPETGIDGRLAMESFRAAGLLPSIIGLQVQHDPSRGTEVLVIEALAASSDKEQIGADISRVLADVPHKILFWDGNDSRPGVDYRASDD